MINWWAVAWAIWAVGTVVSFAVIEGKAIKAGDTPDEPKTLTANTIRLITGTRWWNRAARVIVAGLVIALPAWLRLHFGLAS